MLGVRLGLDVADQLEEMGIFDASTMTAEDARKLTEMAEQQLLDEKSGDENEGGNDGGGDGTGEGGDGKGEGGDGKGDPEVNKGCIATLHIDDVVG